jgi:hypothetical protein
MLFLLEEAARKIKKEKKRKKTKTPYTVCTVCICTVYIISPYVQWKRKQLQLQHFFLFFISSPAQPSPVCPFIHPIPSHPLNLSKSKSTQITPFFVCFAN